MDGSELAECVLSHVETITKGCGVKNVTFVRVVPPIDTSTGGWEYMFSDEERQRMETVSKTVAEEYLKQLSNRIQYEQTEVKREVILGKIPADLIVDYANKNEIDLIVIATHGRSGVSRAIWGSVAGQILRTAGVPVLMVRPKGCIAKH